MIFQLDVIRDPCSYFPFVTFPVEDLTLWVDKPGQTLVIPQFKMNDTVWSCNMTYEIRTPPPNAQTLDSIF
jgi:hypothetical protein